MRTAPLWPVLWSGLNRLHNEAAGAGRLSEDTVRDAKVTEEGG